MRSDIRLERVTITMHDGKPVVRIQVEADSTVISITGTKTVTQKLVLRETPMQKSLDPELVQTIIDAVQKSIEDNVHRLR